ncbi:transcriptional regulator LacI family [Butyrivibrio proteoclasticus B316]|uniref:Transcriptional regulator LacI family n=2 Tax=Lachnospiraceae TaxID=186803 RepID=E0RZ76_BUTPB|nr:transcriptional regulator LacI family [Butyrivibrio proteoclasticus B316]
MSNMKDIAKKAQVSVATVSKVLNGTGNISEETTRKILEIAEELNYHPNLYARNLKTGSSRTIGILAEDLTVFNTPPVIDGIGACCEEKGYRYLLENLRINTLGIDPDNDKDRYSEIKNNAVSHMSSMQVDGIIYLGCHSHRVVPSIFENNIPFVCAYCISPSLAIPSVLYDDQHAAYEAVSLLIKKGHKKIATITGKVSSVHTRWRLTGYQESLYDHNIPYNPGYVVNGDWSRDSGYNATKKLIKQHVTAIFSHNDEMAMGVIDACNDAGIQVGKDIALIGFDNRELSTVCRPTLTTVEPPLFDIGYKSAEGLISKIEHKEDILRGEVRLPCRIIERDST